MAEVVADPRAAAVVRSHVEADRQRVARMDARGGAVERDLPARDAHAARALVAEPEDALVVGDHDQAHLALGGVAQQRRDAIDVVGRDPQAARVAEDVAVLLARLADGRRVDDRHQLGQVLDQHAVEERLVAVEQRQQADELLEVVVLRPQVLELEHRLLLDGQRRRGQEPEQPELLAFFGRERRVLVVARRLEEFAPRDGRNLRGELADDRRHGFLRSRTNGGVDDRHEGRTAGAGTLPSHRWVRGMLLTRTIAPGAVRAYARDTVFADRIRT